MKMKKNLKLLLGIFLAIAFIGIAYAASDEETSAKPEKNMTYGQCVSQQAIIKNTCYESIKDKKETCKTLAGENAAKKGALKQCNSDYKKDKKQCKATFKESKKICARIKHNFLETLGSSLK